MSDFGQGGGGGFGQPPQSGGGGFGQAPPPGGGGFGQPPQGGGFGQPPQGGGFGGPPAGGAGLKPHRGPLILGLGIFALLCCQIAGIVNIFLARADLKEMEAGTMDPEGKTFTTIGFWLGIVAAVFSVLAICVSVVSSALQAG